MSFWELQAPQQDVALSSRVRVARNAAGVPFPTEMNDAQGIEVSRNVLQAFRTRADAERYRYLELRGLDTQAGQVLVERHLISPAILKNVDSGAVLLRDDEQVAVMLNEEDHLRIQTFRAGFQLREAQEEALALSAEIEQTQHMAFHEKLGYLTTCPTNVGTGIRASVMLHLPALRLSGKLRPLMEAAVRTGNAVRGIYGEGSEALGDMYQISNQRTLGLTEGEIVEGVQSVCEDLMEKERQTRAQLQQEKDMEMQDLLLRSYAALRYARRMAYKEFMKCVSDLRLAVALGYVQNLEYPALNQLMLAGQNAALQQAGGTEDVRVLRAALARRTMESVQTL